MTEAYDVDAVSLCAALREVPGVVDARLDPDPVGGPGLLRVRLTRDAEEGSVLAAATAVLRERFHLGVDGGRLRVLDPSGRPVSAVVERAAADPAPDPSPQAVADHAPRAVADPVPDLEPAAGPPSDLEPVADPPSVVLPDTPLTVSRLLLERVEVVSERLEVSARVVLGLEDRRHVGEASAAASPAGGQRAVCQATARAAESALDGRARVDVEAVDLLAVGSDRVAVVVVTLLGGRGVERLSGAALVRDDPREALVRATLDALNRRVESHLRRAADDQG